MQRDHLERTRVRAGQGGPPYYFLLLNELQLACLGEGHVVATVQMDARRLLEGTLEAVAVERLNDGRE